MKMKLEDISKKISKGSTPRGKVNYSKNEKNYFLRVTDMVDLANVYNSEFTLSDEDINKNKMKIWPINTVLVSIEGTVGKISILKKEMSFNQAVAGIIPNEEIINPRYLMYYLRTTPVFSGILKGTIMPALRLSDLSEIEIEVPDMETQNKMVSIADSITNKIDLNNKINNNLYDLGNAIFKEWQTSCIETKTIGELSDNIIKYSKGEEQYVKLLNSSDVTEGIFIDTETVPNIDLKGHFKKKFEKYDILYSEIRPRNKHYGYVLFDDYDKFIASTRLMVIRANNMISSSLLYFSIMSSEVLEEFTLKTESRSGTFPQGNYEDMSKISIPFSSNQEDITKQLDVTLEKINSNYCENKILEQLRDTLLPKLMNGEIDLDNIEI